MPYKVRKLKYMNLQDDEQFYKFLRLSLGLTQEFPVNTDSDEWLRLYQTAVRQSLVGVCWQGVCLLTEDKKPPVELVLRWVVDAEMVRSMNTLQNQEAARLTKLFAGHGRRTAIPTLPTRIRYRTLSLRDIPR